MISKIIGNQEKPVSGDGGIEVVIYPTSTFTDFNSLTEQGYYRIDEEKANVSNAPSVTGNYISGFVSVVASDSNNLIQEFFCVSDSQIYIRFKWNGILTSWSTH